MDNQKTGKEDNQPLLDTASLKTYINDENLNDLPKEDRDRKSKEEPKSEDFEPFKDPAHLKRLKKDTPTEDKN
ncbi:hypothetical protein SAMN04488700_1543 [Carnobacterium iners]|uniref:Uncharacterized protein n=1 Tax=Carnobacterium iners TaxID=1073423 RepID=A0A1X7N804_9LACT|nr:hypothetical protein [Carnobacterium iners]SEL22796.1 hypothetical protein SAMN04488114_1385 [Carnobacterium iners]SMH33660.1 hypothetical protein SAMN04488700_1543 [Carnobacterium iners]